MSRNLDVSQSVLAVVDIQDRLFCVFDADMRTRITRQVGVLIESAKTLSVPIAVTEQYPPGLGITIAPVIEALPEGHPRYAKLTFSCIESKEFMDDLAQWKRSTIVLCGTETHICVYQTALDLLDLGFRVVVAADAVGSRREENWRWGLDALRQAGAEILPTETITFGWLRRAGTDEFKRTSKLIK